MMIFLLGGSPVQAACPGQNLLGNPPDPSEFGPWPVGNRTVAGAPAYNDGSFTPRKITAEVFFPAVPGSEVGKAHYWYSQKDQNLPPVLARKIPQCPANNPHPSEPTCCQPHDPFSRVFPGLELDTAHGPYPVIIFIHGTAAWRSYMLEIMQLWASRGFIVFSADYPGICSYDMLQKRGHTDQQGDTELIIDALKKLEHPDLQFLKGHIDMSRLGITGHSAGGYTAGKLSGNEGMVVIPMAGGGTSKRLTEKYSTVVIGGALDTIVGGCQGLGYLTSPRPKRHLCIARAGHNTYTDLCSMAPQQGGICGIGQSCGIPGAAQFARLADQGCRFSTPPAPEMNIPESVWPVVRYATSAAFEEVLMCNTNMTVALSQLKQHFNSSVVNAWSESL